MPTTAPRTLADQLRGWSDTRLAALLRARPDVAVPAPLDTAQLAARLATRPSVVRALDGLTRLDLAVLDAVLHLAPATRDAVAEVVTAEADAVRTCVDGLLDLALVWGDPERELRPVSVLGDLMKTEGPPPETVAALREALSAPARAMLDHLDAQDADGFSESTTPPLEELLAARLVRRRDNGARVVVPWSVRVGLRGGRSTREPVDVPPALATTSRPAARVDRAAAGAAFELVRRTELLLEQWGTRPPGVLRSGGLGVRDLRAAADLLQVTPSEAGLVVETAAAAGLLGVGSSDAVDPAWLPTDAFDAWQEESTAQRWAVLALTWLRSPRMVSLVGGRDENDRPVNALTVDLARGWLPALRAETLAELGGTTDALAGDGLDSLLTRMRWRHPRRSTIREPVVRAVLDEAALVGVTGRDALSSPGRALVAGDDAAAALAPLLPDPVDHVLIQADLTAVAPGPLERGLGRALGLMADVESRGGATTYRFTAASLRRALDAGWTVGEVKGLLASASRTEVPQALDYLVDDVSRRFGTLRAGLVASYLRSDDEAALTELVHLAADQALGLRRLAPTVVVSDVPLDVLLPRLRDLGAAPVVEADDGTVRVARPDALRARASRRPDAPRSGPETLPESRLPALVASVRAGDRLAASRPDSHVATSPGDVLGLLRGSADAGEAVRIGYVDGHGTHVERVVDPVRVDGGQLIAVDQHAQETRSFAIHRIARASRVG